MAAPATLWFMVRVALAVVTRPHLWRASLRQLGRVTRPAWWRRPPFLPLPDPGWLRFRLELAYGVDPPRVADVRDVLDWLEWCREHDEVAA